MNKKQLLLQHKWSYCYSSSVPQAHTFWKGGGGLQSAFFSFEEEHLPIPGGPPEALYELHAAQGLQVVPGVLRHIPSDPQALEVVEVRPAQLPQPTGRGPIALPGLSLQDEVVAHGGQAGEERQQGGVSVVQVDPHGDGETEAHLEAGVTVILEVVLQRIPVASGGGGGDVQRNEGDVPGMRVGLLGSLDEALVQVEPQDVSCCHRVIGALFLLWSQH